MDEPRRGFACGDNARLAAKKNHEMGTAHRFDAHTGAEAGRKSAEKRWGDRKVSRESAEGAFRM